MKPNLLELIDPVGRCEMQGGERTLELKHYDRCIRGVTAIQPRKKHLHRSYRC